MKPIEPAPAVFGMLLLVYVIAISGALGLAEAERESAGAVDLAARCVDGWSEDRARLEVCLGVADACRAVLLEDACACWIPGGEP